MWAIFVMYSWKMVPFYYGSLLLSSIALESGSHFLFFRFSHCVIIQRLTSCLPWQSNLMLSLRLSAIQQTRLFFFLLIRCCCRQRHCEHAYHRFQSIGTEQHTHLPLLFRLDFPSRPSVHDSNLQLIWGRFGLMKCFINSRSPRWR